MNLLGQVFPQIDLPSLRTEDRIITEGREYIEVYKSNLIEDKSYEIAFKKIGIFNEDEIDLVSYYNAYLKQSLLFIDIFCCTMGGDTEIYHENMGKVKFKDITKTENRNLMLSFTNIQILIPITKILGYLCLYQLSLNYSQQYSAKYRENLLKEWRCLLKLFSDDSIFSYYEFAHSKLPNLKIKFHILQRTTSDTLIQKLNYIRESYRKIDKAKDTNDRKPNYLFRILINNSIYFIGMQKNGNPSVLITIISSQETFTDSTWEIIPNTAFITHTKKMLKSYIKEKLKNKLEGIYEIKYLWLGSKLQQNILEKDIDGLEEHLDEDIDKFITENCEYESYIISPWGIDIDSIKMKFSQV
ncbi:MAG: hypothetical protein F6K17_19385 [Okeania sp. SIO3C4]|nr:hypothetical protein [Okeania sp. SIO3C4]